MLFESSLVENPEIFAIGLGLITFFITHAFFTKKLNFERGSSLLISVAIGGLVAYSLYQNRIVLRENLFSYALLLLVLAFFFVIFRAFTRFSRR